MYIAACIHTNLLVCFQFFACKVAESFSWPDISRYTIVGPGVQEELMDACNVHRWLLSFFVFKEFKGGNYYWDKVYFMDYTGTGISTASL